MRVRLPTLTTAGLLLGALTILASALADAAPRRRKDKAEESRLLTVDLSALGLEGRPTLTLEMPPDLWRAHRVTMTGYPAENQLTRSESPRVASRWLQSTVDDGLVRHAQVFLVVQPAATESVRQWARRIAGEAHRIYPFEDARFDGPWIANEERFRLASRKRVGGVLMENSGGRVGEQNRAVWQLALLPVGDVNVMLCVKRRAPTSWAPGKGGPPAPGSVGDGGTGVPGPAGDGSGSLPGSGGAGDGALSDGVGSQDGLGNVNTEPDANQVRASSELLRALLEGVQLAPTDRMRRGTRRFQMRDEWNGPRGLTTRYVGISAPSSWASVPTSALRGDRIEWCERADDGALTAVARVELIGIHPPASLREFVRLHVLGWDVTDAKLVDVQPRDGRTVGVLCETPLATPSALRAGDDRGWVRDVGYVATDSTIYEVEIARPPDSERRTATLREMLESVEISVAY